MRIEDSETALGIFTACPCSSIKPSHAIEAIPRPGQPEGDTRSLAPACPLTQMLPPPRWPYSTPCMYPISRLRMI